MADQKTLAFYSENAETIFERYESAPSEVQNYFTLSFPAGAKVLDVGAGSSRDLRALLAQGYDAYGVEPCEALRSKALKHHPDLSSRLFAGALPQLDTNEEYDGILCSAVFMHIPESEQVQALVSLRELLRPGGRLLISIAT